MEARKLIDRPANDWGRVTFYGYLQKPSGPSLRKKRVILTVISEDDDDILASEGLASLRQARIVRICTEAYEQGALLSYEDLTTLLLSSLSTVKRDLRLLRKQGISVPIYRKKQRPIKRN